MRITGARPRASRRLTTAALATTLLVGPAVLMGGASATAAPASLRSGNGLTVVSMTHPSSRQWRLVVRTPELAQPVKVDLLLPSGYTKSTRRYPSLYLFHGTSGGADDWLRSGGVAAATRPLPLIVVMADAGYKSNGGSFFTDWADQRTPLGVANWERFHIDQLIPWVDAHLRTVRSRAGRAIAGLSQGGFGSMSYAARHPDLFTSAAAFSGAPDLFRTPAIRAAATAVVGSIATGLDNVEPNAMFGDAVTRAVNWQGHNPADLVTNLRSVSLALWTGDGTPGPLDPPTPSPPATGIEAITHQSTLSFVHWARASRVPFYLDDYGPGTHSWPYWSRDLRQYLPRLMARFAHPGAAPTVISYRSIDRVWRQWGWTVSNQRTAAQAFSGLGHASIGRFTYKGAPTAIVTTPAVYRPRATYRVQVGTSRPVAVRASTTRRLRITVTTTGAAVLTTIRLSHV